MLTNRELWSEIRRRALAGEISLRQACPEYHLNFRTARKIVRHAEPPPLRAPQPRAKPVLGPFLPALRQVVDDDRYAPPKQRHTARRIYERLRDERGYAGCPGIVRDAARLSKQSQAEVVVPLPHPPGEGQVDFGRAEVVAAGVRHKAALFVLTLPHGNARFGCLFPRECTESFHEGRARALAFFGGVATRVSYDNSKIAVVKLAGPHGRQLAREFLRLQSHFAFAAHFGRLRQAHEQGHVEDGVGYVRRNFLVPVPRADSWDDLNAHLAAACRREFERTGGGRDRATAELLAAGRAAFLPPSAEPFEARRVEPVTINSPSPGRFDGNDSSVPTAFAYQPLTATGTIDRRESVILPGGPGTGKTHVAIGLATAACQRGKRARFFRVTELRTQLLEAREERVPGRLRTQLARLDLLVLDEFGYVPTSQVGAGPLFDVISTPYERASVIVTTNLPFERWTEVPGNERLVAATLDRLTHRCHLPEATGESHRLGEARRRRQASEGGGAREAG